MDNVFNLLDPKIRGALAELGMTEPTETQAKALPVILSGRHTLVIAPTGTGKTETAMLPAFDMLLKAKPDGRAGTSVLY
ncbi:MAG TPA: DEAD/DEAH box helicase, partial [Methanocella sp.]|nr:DEAD/DEAH box helicase [Methanocella sp.]